MGVIKALGYVGKVAGDVVALGRRVDAIEITDALCLG
jgi:hypothetical protein